jgi:hypothetical protein
MNIWLVGAELFREDGRIDSWADMTKVISVFGNFANVSFRSNVSSTAECTELIAVEQDMVMRTGCSDRV